MSVQYTPGEEYMVQMGKKHIWQNPRRDKHHIVQLARISPRNGWQSTGRVGLDTIETPTVNGYYHFYQIGDNYPGDFTLIARKNKWYRLSDWCKVIDLVIHAYDKHGRMLPIQNLYQIRLYNDNIIIAIERNDNVFDLNTEEVYLRFYRNYYYTTGLKDDKEIHIEYLSNTHSNESSTEDLLKTFNGITSRKRGAFRLIHNGYLTDTIDFNDVEYGDVTEFHYDLTVRKKVDIPVSSLRTYTSSLDNCTKYLIHPPKTKLRVIDYRDDIDIFIYKRFPNGKVKGLYYHRNREDAVRMVTHQDYGLPVAYVMSYIEYLDPNANLQDFYIRLYIRDNGENTPIYEDVNMITSLYVLSDEKIVEAMTRVDSTVPEWKANHLEQSTYTALMRSYAHEITPAMCLEAFGYSSSAKLLAEPNIKLTRSRNGDFFALPIGLQRVCTVFEYTEKGLLLGWYHHFNLVKYYPRSERCHFVEAVSGLASDDITMHIGNQPFKMINDTAYRFYSAKVEQNEVVGYWNDVTSDKRILVDHVNKTCTFNYQGENEVGIAIGDDKFLCYEMLLDGKDGIYDFRLTYEKEHVKPLVIPPGRIDLYLNGKALVEDIDYFVDFPRIMIVNKRYLMEGLQQHVVVRCTGFPVLREGILKRIKSEEVGFVQYGEVSANAHHNIHPSKVLRVNVNGGVYHPDVVPFDEDGRGTIGQFAPEGAPYAIEHPYISLHGSLSISLHQAKIKDYDLTLRASDYLTYHLPKLPRPLPPVIDDKYEVYSPFLSRISMDIYYGLFKSPLPSVSIQTIDKMVEKYKVYLPLDPTIRGYDKHFVNVHAHNQRHTVPLTARDVAFLERLNDIYLRDSVDVSKFYTIRNGK